MQSSPGISISSLTKGKVFNEVDLSGEVEPELEKLHIELVTATVDVMDASLSLCRHLHIQTLKFLTLCNGHMIRWS